MANTVPVKAVHNLDINQQFRSSYQLQERYSTKLDVEAMNIGIQPLIQQGFSDKKAREVYAHPHVLKVFEEQFNLWNGEKCFRKIGSTVTTLFDPTKDGAIDDIFWPAISYTFNHISLAVKGQLCGTYTQIHYGEKEEIQPYNLYSLWCKHKIEGPYWDPQGNLVAVSVRPAGVTTVIPPFPSFLWGPALATALIASQTPVVFKMLNLKQTFTVIQADGTLTVYDVVDA